MAAGGAADGRAEEDLAEGSAEDSEGAEVQEAADLEAVSGDSAAGGQEEEDLEGNGRRILWLKIQK